MTERVSPPVFLERQTYRRRRLLDAARLLPFLGAVLFAVPLLWPTSAAKHTASAQPDPLPMSHAVIYIFLAWAGLIALSFIFGFIVRNWTGAESADRSGRS